MTGIHSAQKYQYPCINRFQNLSSQVVAQINITGNRTIQNVKNGSCHFMIYHFCKNLSLVKPPCVKLLSQPVPISNMDRKRPIQKVIHQLILDI